MFNGRHSLKWPSECGWNTLQMFWFPELCLMEHTASTRLYRSLNAAACKWRNKAQAKAQPKSNDISLAHGIWHQIVPENMLFTVYYQVCKSAYGRLIMPEHGQLEPGYSTRVLSQLAPVLSNNQDLDVLSCIHTLLVPAQHVLIFWQERLPSTIHQHRLKSKLYKP